MSKSNKPNTNTDSTAYLIMGSNSEGLDNESFLVFKGKLDLTAIVKLVESEWDNYPIDHIKVLPFKMSSIKSIKKTLELV